MYCAHLQPLFVASVLGRAMDTIEEAARGSEGLVRCMYGQLCVLMDQYRVLFQDDGAVAMGCFVITFV